MSQDSPIPLPEPEPAPVSSSTNPKTAKVSRRGFLRCAGIALGASVVACGGIGYLASQLSPDNSSVQVETPSFIFGEDAAEQQRILVLYATRTGSTVGVASAVGETLAARGNYVEVKPVREVQSIDGYQAVVIGSAINGGSWLPEAVDFATQHQQALLQIPVAIFAVHIMNLGDDEASKAKRTAYLDNVRTIKPVSEGYFAGIGMDVDEQNGLLRFIYSNFDVGPEGDNRDWNKIRAWAKTIFA